MKSNVLAFVIAAASLGSGTVSLAQDHQRHGWRDDGLRTAYQAGQQNTQRMDQRTERRNDRREDRINERRADRRDHRLDHRWDHRNSHRPDYRGHDVYVYRSDGHRPIYNARGPQFRRGGYIPQEFRHRHYPVVNYRTYRLSAPPRGHQWVQVGTDYVLIAMATGLIAHIVLNH